jgi:hypothetical protein
MSKYAEAARLALIAAAGKIAADERLPDPVRDAAVTACTEGVTLNTAAVALLDVVLAAETEAKGYTAQINAASKGRTACVAAVGIARDALREMIEDTGMPAVRGRHHTAALTASPPSVVITDAAALPARFLRQPPPEPDKEAIRTAIASGETVPGALLSNPPQTLRINTNRKD